MGVKEFKIVFDNPYEAYFPDQTVTGKVILTLDSTKKIRGIKLSVKGEADTCWSIDNRKLGDDRSYMKETEIFKGHEEYFKAQFYLLGSASGEEIELPPGTHTYPFNYVLPPNLPNSFESEIGSIRYTAKAILDRPWKFDQETKVAFSVISHLDLNQLAQASESILLEKSKTFCCLCCGSPPLTVNISVPVRGYVPGQTIPIKVNVENHSGITVELLKLKLDKVITYTATSPHTEKKEEESTVAEVSKGPVGGTETTNYEQLLEIPPLPPSHLKNCGIIDLEYKLKIEACVTGFYHKNLRESTLIYIGTVPLSSYQMPYPPVANTDYQKYYTTKEGQTEGMYPSIPTPSAPEEPSNYNPASNLYPNLAPPSYEQSTYGATNIRDREESEYVIGIGERFAPRYPVYNFKPTQ